MTGGTNQGCADVAEICAVMVTYHPDAGLAGRISRILPQVGALILVDNGSSGPALEMLQALCATPRVTWVTNGANLGIARALNVGLERAAQGNFNFALLLDQDSNVQADMSRTLLSGYHTYPEPERLAAVGAGFEGNDLLALPEQAESDVRAGPASGGAARTCAAPEWQEVESVITSGSLIPLATHARIGPFREELFIDYVDMDYCARARARGFRVIAVRRHIMAHAIGAPTRHRRLFWPDTLTTNHAPDRRYYIARNDTLMLKEHGRYALGAWALKSLGRRLRTCKRILLYEDAKAAKLAAVAAGWWDGVRGRLGPRPP